MFFKIFRKIAIPVILATTIAAGLVICKSGLYESMSGYWSTPERNVVINELTAFKEINRLYTGFYLVPVMDISYGSLKRDLLPIIGSETSKPVPKGYCLKKFDAGLGYDNVLDLLQDEPFMGCVCSGDLSALPNPKLLSINSTAAEINGDYTGNCRDWDLEQNQQLRRAVIYRELAQTAKSHSIPWFPCSAAADEVLCVIYGTSYFAAQFPG